jgi:hypothetical protein
MYLVQYKGELPEDVEQHFRDNSRKQFNTDIYREVKIVKKIYSEDKSYFSGIIYFKKRVKDFDYSVKNLTEAEIIKKDTFIGNELDFIILYDSKVVLFFYKDETVLFGSKILSNILFSQSNGFKPIIFDCTAIFKNKKKEKISDIQFNGVRCKGKITAQGQWGTDIDNDNDFINSNDRYGIGFLWKGLRITIFRSGSVIFKANVKNFSEQMKIRKMILSNFLKYSNYSTI